MGAVIPKLRASARGQYCTMHIVGVCLGGTETTVLAHLPSPVKGMGNKGDDYHAVFACRACHDALDQRRLSITEEYYYTIRALRSTIKFWIENGYLVIPGVLVKQRKPSSKTVQRSPLYVQGD